jgi:hypothetical protein
MSIEILRKKYKQVQAEKIRYLEKDRKASMDPAEFKDRFGSDLKPPREQKQQTPKEANKTIQLREKLKNTLKQTQADEITDKGNKEK